MRKKLLLISAICFFVEMIASAQSFVPRYPDSLFSTYYHQRVSEFRLLPNTQKDVVFLGNSITDGGEWAELFDDLQIKNRGISGDVTTGVLNRLDEIIDRKPAKVFLLIGINDLVRGKSADTIVQHIFQIADLIHAESADTKLFIQSILPVNNNFKNFSNHVNKTEQVKKINQLLRNNEQKHHYSFIDLYPFFTDKNGKLDSAYTNDGLHLMGPGYMRWKSVIYPFVYDLQNKPSLLPLPQQLKWQDDASFSLYRCKEIVVKDTMLMQEGLRLQSMLKSFGWNTKIVNNASSASEPTIELQLSKVETPLMQNEAYRLSVNKNKIRLHGNTPHGIFNGLQTLFQLMRDHFFVPGCEITDWPSFQWRGYLSDVGRNYQSLELLKQQIEIMSRYKMNVFHFHPTEDIAWRLQIKKYPQLTEPQFMERNKGSYYTVDDMKELIRFCKERYIEFVPEIDMPGHSAAFTRAMGVDMQSDSGLAIVKNILKEVMDTYDLPYVHIGGDEVKITNKNFLPEAIKFIHDYGKQTIGWEPGGNLENSTIRQLWMTEGSVNPKLQYIDSRHLYLNHMDPLESVVTIFNRKIGDRDKADKNVLGGAICLWHDRNVAKQEDVVTMNPVYPAMLAFAERSWRGGGYAGWVADIGADGSQRNRDFKTFENRLMDQKKQYFSRLSFPYLRQSAMHWKLFGPYNNKGNLSSSFAPEKKDFNFDTATNFITATGGTIVLRHFWHPLISSVLSSPKDSTTWYAYSNHWSNADTSALMWIDFYNYSRSTASDSPKEGTWNNLQSKIWLNDSIISPPQWNRAGQKGNLEIPYTDEGYWYRAPIKVNLKKGWNQLLVKLPVGSFKEGVWHTPVKWMFTAAFVE